MESTSIRRLADRARVDEEYVRHLMDVGALDRDTDRFEERDVHLVALLNQWESAGLAIDSILKAVEAGVLSFEFLETPGWTLPERLGPTYREFAQEKGVPLRLLLGVHEAIGFAAPDPDDRVGPDDAVLAELIRTSIEAGTSDEVVLRLFRIYADNLRRLATAEAELYVAEVQKRWRESGVTESELMRSGAQTGRRMLGPVQAALAAIYDRHRQHVWSDYSISQAEAALEQAGLYRRASRTPAICFVDLTGYTRLTEERGDEAAARLASSLATMVEEISHRHGGRPIRWLGDGGMFFFKESSAAALAALEMVESAPARGLPPTHIGIQTGPVVFRDGDVYGRTVNIAARIAAVAGAGEVLTSEETVRQVDSGEVRFEQVGPAELKGIAQPLTLYRALRVKAVLVEEGRRDRLDSQ